MSINNTAKALVHVYADKHRYHAGQTITNLAPEEAHKRVQEKILPSILGDYLKRVQAVDTKSDKVNCHPDYAGGVSHTMSTYAFSREQLVAYTEQIIIALQDNYSLPLEPIDWRD